MVYLMIINLTLSRCGLIPKSLQVNDFLTRHLEILMPLSSRWAFSVSACLAPPAPCADCNTHGILALHGCDMVFFRNIDIKFQVRRSNRPR